MIRYQKRINKWKMRKNTGTGEGASRGLTWLDSRGPDLSNMEVAEEEEEGAPEYVSAFLAFLGLRSLNL